VNATHCDRIYAYLKEHGSATVRELMLKCGTNWPHKRLDEMTSETGEVFRHDGTSWQATGERIVRESRRYRGRDIRVYRMVRA
jgi:hypothetical protein